MKTTGHDYLGRSTAFGSLLLWLHYMKNMTLIESFPLCSGENISNVIRVGADVQWGEVYNWLAQYNLIAIGGASATVGASGGFLQGGGHGPLTRWKGLAADQVLEFDVIMADGSRQTVNECENGDLFWALRGGGGGTFAVVLSVVLRTYPSPTLIGSIQTMRAPNETRYNDFIHNFVDCYPHSDLGWSGYFYLIGETFAIAFFLPNGDINVANTIISLLISNYSDLQFLTNLVYPFASFNEFYDAVLKSGNPTGSNVLLGSRLIPETVIRNQSGQVAHAFFQAKGGNESFLIGHLVAGDPSEQKTG